MRRFIRYLYEYQHGQRVRNIGFVKVEQDQKSTSVHIHGKGMRLQGEQTIQLYIFFKHNDRCIGIFQGNIEKAGTAINECLTYTDEDTGRPENYPLIEGIILKNAGECRFAALWNDTLVNIERMEEWEPEKEEKELLPEEPEIEEELSTKKTEMTEELPLKGKEEIEEYVEPTQPQYTKIERQDIAKLPRCEWRLANNSFLLHGYHNYHHLIFLDDGSGRWLGVPGIYHPREARAAEAFGFPRFVKIEEQEIALTEEEGKDAADFGYWCRQVRV